MLRVKNIPEGAREDISIEHFQIYNFSLCTENQLVKPEIPMGIYIVHRQPAT